MSLYKEISLPSGKTYTQPITSFINNEYVASSLSTQELTSENSIPVYNPATGEKIVDLYEACSEKDVNVTIQNAKKAYKSWKKVSQAEKRDCFLKLATLVEENKQILMEVESFNSGKPVLNNSKYDLEEVIEVLKYFAGWIDKLQGSTHISDDDNMKLTYHQPLGIVGCIIPFNYPLTMMINKFASIAVGNCAIFKPADQTPLSLLFFSKFVKEAGFPPGVFQVLIGKGSTVGDKLVTSTDIAKIAFTGSTAVGKMIQARSAINMKALSLECGGKSPMVIFDDCNLEKAIEWSCIGLFSNSGQICSGTSKVYVQKGIYKKFLEGLLVHLKENYPVGDPFDENVVVGPVISAKQYEKIIGYIETSIKEGLTLVAGGVEKPSHILSDDKLKNGFYVQPTIFTGLTEKHTINKEEIFGPVMALAEFETYDEVIEKCNDNDYGLGSACFTNNLQKAIKFSKDIEAGIVWINSSNDTNSHTPFGGIKQSGNGSRDNGYYTLLNYTNVKGVHINLEE
ncbi:hypothetical protein QEN19_000672 [Hanseniaspora menglaensis]